MSEPAPPSRLKKWLRDGAIMAVLTVVLLVAIELAIRLIAPQTMRTTFGESGPLGQLDPELGYVYRPSTSADVRGPEFEVRYEINADGMRDHVAHVRPKPAGLTRVLVLGDSFAFGAGNAIDDSWAAVLERGLRARGLEADVVKAGVSGYDTRNEALLLERLSPEWQPDIVVVGFLPNDLFTNLAIGDPRADEMQAVVATSATEQPFSLHVVTLAKRLAMNNDQTYINLYLMTGRADYFRAPPTERMREQLAITEALLARMKSHCDERGAELIILSIPQQFQVLARQSGVPGGFDVELVDREMAAIAAAGGYTWAPTLSLLSEAYAAAGDDLYFRLDGHLNEAGNQVVGERLATLIAARSPG